MFREFFSGSDLMVWPLIGLLIFATIFAGVLAFTFLGLRDRRKLDDIAALPLQPDDGDEDRSEGRAAR
jgi:hypothetical protein